MNIDHNLILIKGEDKTASVTSWRFDQYKPVVFITFNGQREYPYNTAKAVDKEVQISYNNHCMAINRVISDGITEFSVRCVRIKLTENTEEILITNLDRKEFPKRYIKEIYEKTQAQISTQSSDSFQNYLFFYVDIDVFRSKTCFCA